ncbi:MAG: hypothetical protein DRN26_02790 [Thermoplasmata archaeon]|nr:MAG: hypothetical protein DRN26_02790 [Thermoplasmata archaeon]
MSVRVEVKGLYEAVLLIERVSRIARIHWPNKALDNLAKHAKQKMKELVPKRTGKLRRSIRIESLPDARKIVADTPYARIVNDGARPHYIYPKSKKALAFFKEGKWVVKARVHHPGFVGYDFLENTMNYVYDFMYDWLAEEIDLGEV